MSSLLEGGWTEDNEGILMVVENLLHGINNDQLRSIFERFGAKRCRVVFRKENFKGNDMKEIMNK